MTCTIKIPLGVGKAEGVREHIEALHRSKIPDKLVPEYIDYATKHEIENCDIRRMLTAFGPDADRKLLRESQGKVLFAVEGYDNTPEELIEIPEIRRYFRFVFETWPHWLFSGSVFSPNLMVIVLSTLPNVTIVRDAESVTVRYQRADMEAFLNKAVLAAAWLQHRIGISRRKGLSQLRMKAGYLGLEL